MIAARWGAMLWSLAQVLAYSEMPYPRGVKAAGVALSLGFGVVNVGVAVARRRTRTLPHARRLAVTSLSLDVVLASGMVWLYTFDQISALWAVLFILPLEGALRFQLSGAMGSWVAVTVLYIGREIWGSNRYHYALQWNSITFRMGTGLLIAVVAGVMAKSLVKERSHLAAAVTELQGLDRTRAGLVSMLAHDIRAPLTVITGVAQTLMREDERLDSDTKRALLASVERQAGRLNQLANDLLDLARLESGRLELSPEPVRVEEAVVRAMPFVDRDRAIEVRVDPKTWVTADPARLEQVIVNLSSNMLRHGGPPFLITASQAGDMVTLSFRDGGPGVPEDARSGLFDPFSSGDRRSTGLGLAIVKALAEAHGGGASYEAGDARGSCFEVTLPVASPPA